MLPVGQGHEGGVEQFVPHFPPKSQIQCEKGLKHPTSDDRKQEVTAIKLINVAIQSPQHVECTEATK